MTRSSHNEINGGLFFSAVIQGRNITLQLPPQVIPALHAPPAPSPAFTGRADDLRVVLDTLAPRPPAEGGLVPPTEGTAPIGGTALVDGMAPVSGMAPAGGAPPTGGAVPAPAVVVTAVGGMGGVGKTELALQAAHTALRMGWFPGGVLFADLFGYDTARRRDPGQILDGWLRDMGVPNEHIPSTPQDRARLYTSVLAVYAQKGRRILVVIDNASSHEQVRPLLPSDGVTAAIVTSRHTLGMLSARLLDLDVLAPADAVTLLERTLQVSRLGDRRITDHPETALTLARLCGGLPLALRIVAALLAVDPTCSPAEIVARLSGADSRLEQMEYDTDLPVDAAADPPYRFAVSATLDLSYQHLVPEQARLFRLLPLNPGPEISTDAAAILAGLEHAAARRLLEGLARAHLIERGSAYGRWRMHDLVRLFADRYGRAHAGPDERVSALTTLLEYYLSGAIAANGHLDDTFDDPVTDAFPGRDEALAWLDVEYPNLAAAVPFAAGNGHHLIAWALPMVLAKFFGWRRLLNDRVTLTGHALHAARHLGNRHGEGTALSHLGIALRQLRRFDEAISTCRQAVRILRETGDRNGEGQALSNLGDALWEARHFDEAITTHRQSVEIHRETNDRHGEASALNSLGDVLQEVRRFDEAITAHRQAAHLYRETGDRHGEAGALNSLGNALGRTGHPGEAITAYRQAARVFYETGDRHSEGAALNNLGGALRVVGALDEAVTAHRHALRVFEETHDRHSEGVATNNLGSILREVGALDEAVTAHRQAIDIYHETGDRHGEAQALINLGIALSQARRFDEAVTTHRQAIDIYHETGDRHGEAQALNNLGIALGQVKRFDQAIATHRQAATFYHETGDRYGEAGALTNLGNALLQVMRSAEAVAACRQATDAYRETGDRHGEAKALGNLGIALGQAGRFDEAIAAVRGAAVIFRETGDRHSESIATNILGRILEAQRSTDGS
ncbi:tetratricopeptide repeat protein [Streptosporangium sp. NPDC051022]|uniref:tetratricopeptide repeat protein n=1 Tax=Streptosporangium sp. NPDC051022 TaxID=3155752 RepID=UPI00341DF9B0